MNLPRQEMILPQNLVKQCGVVQILFLDNRALFCYSERTHVFL